MTRLDAINQMLDALGEAPVSTINSQHPDVLVATNKLNSLLERIQAKGAWYNTDENLTLVHDSATGEVVLPSNTLKVDPVDTRSPYIKRGTKLYDPSTSTFVIGKDVSVDVVVRLDFEDLPVAAQQLIAAQGSYELHLSLVGDEQKLNRLLQLLEDAQGEYKADEINHQDFNAKNTPTAARLLSRMVPYRRT